MSSTDQPVDGAAPATAFQLSRLYAKGWLAGSNCAVDDSAIDTTAQAEALNPCHAADERSRWAQGFLDALQRQARGPVPKKPRFTAGNAAKPAK